MTKNQKIAIGIGALALGYWLYTKNKASKSAETQLSQEMISCLRSKMIVANGKITEQQFNNLVANNFSESSISSLVDSLSKVANPKADIQALKKSAMAEIYSLLKNCKDSQSNTTPSTTGTTTFEPPISSLPKKINVHTCKDGFKINVPDYGMMTFAKVQDPCWKHGGTVNYVPIENVSTEGKCPTGFKKVDRMCKQAPCPYDCVPYAKPNGMV